MTVETLGIDIAKNVFQLHGVNHHGCVEAGASGFPIWALPITG
jgi:hypothetical protein